MKTRIRFWPETLIFFILLLVSIALAWIFFETRNATNALVDSKGIVHHEAVSRIRNLLTLSASMLLLLTAISAFLFWRVKKITVKFLRAAAIRRESYNRYRFLAEGPPSIGIVRFSLSEGLFLDANRAAFTLLSYARAQFVGQTIQNFIIPSDHDLFEKEVSKLAKGKKNLEFTVGMMDSTGNVKDIEWHVSRISRADSDEPEAIAILTDVTEIRRAEEDRLEKERLQGVLEMAGAAAHELNQPIQVLLGFSDMILREIDDRHPLYTKITAMKKSIDRISRVGRKISSIKEYRVKSYAGRTTIIDIDKASSSAKKSKSSSSR